MALTARLDSPLALYRKLERESYRAFHAPTPLHKADHFFNFCVTAASMRDYTLEHLKKIQVLELSAFTDQILKYWRSYLTSLGIKVPRQSFAQLTGYDA